MGLASVENQYLDGRAALTCGEKTASEIDDEVLSIISGCYDEAKRLLAENREILDKISDYLYRARDHYRKRVHEDFPGAEGNPGAGDSVGERAASGTCGTAGAGGYSGGTAAGGAGRIPAGRGGIVICFNYRKN